VKGYLKEKINELETNSKKKHQREAQMYLRRVTNLT
jgi:hypothetical protein